MGVYQFSYLEVAEDSSGLARENERKALGHSIDLLRAAATNGPESRDAIEAMSFVNRLWSILLEDLSQPDNSLEPNLKARLISIGLWVLKEADLIRQGQSNNFDGLIAVSEAIHAGLE